ncbi:MAG: hypothetical protein ACKOTD_07730 [Phycisphaerales bacterium]
MVSPGAAVTFAGVNAKFETETVITAPCEAPTTAAASTGARRRFPVFKHAMPEC